MALVRRIRKRGANIVVEANGEVLFAPNADIGRFKQRFSHRITAATIAAAPTNKRPRWGHYGRPLKATITSSTTTRITRGGGFFYIAVGATAPHAYYVDQGTGIYGGNGPYEAKVLPPWHRGSPSLYEYTWRPGGPGQKRVRTVMIEGQRGQHFFDAGLKRGFESMRMRSFQVPGEGITGLSSAMATFPSGLENFVGNTPSDGAFRASLVEWRGWRDAAWRGEHGPWGNSGMLAQKRERMAREARLEKRRLRSEVRHFARAQRSKERSQRRRDAIKAMQTAKDPTKNPKVPKARETNRQKAEMAAKLAAVKFFNNPKHRGFKIVGTLAPWGFYYTDRGGTKHQHFWSAHVADLFAEAGVKFRPPPKHT